MTTCGKQLGWFLGVLLFLAAELTAQEQSGSIRGVVRDKDFDAPLAGVKVTLVENGAEVQSSDQGNYVAREVPPGRYTVVFSRDGYVRQVRADVVVSPGQLTDLNVALSGDFVEMDEMVVEDVGLIGGATEVGLLQLRFENPALMDSIGSDLMGRAGASDAAAALTLVTGATVQDGKFAVIRGLPDRYVSSQLNGVRLPSADEDTRAVELDQFPSAVIESVQVSKTFTPDQQGDASGGAVNVLLKSIPDKPFFLEFKSELGYNSNVGSRNDFLTYDGGGVDLFGDSNRAIQFGNLGDNWTGAAGTSTGAAPTDSKWSLSMGGMHEVEEVRFGAFANLFYERDSLYYDDGIKDSYWVENPGDPMTPRSSQGTPQDGTFLTSLFDVTQGREQVQLGGLVTGGIEAHGQSLHLAYLSTHTAEDIATLATDTRGKEYYFPGYDVDDPMGPGNQPNERFAAPYIRTETLDYTERDIESVMLQGRHVIPVGELALGSAFKFLEPELDWTLARSSADSNQPDKRQFGAIWLPSSYNPGVPPYVPPFYTPPEWFPYKPAANFSLGNFQRIWKRIEEDSDQYFANLKLPFDQWDHARGYLKFGVFSDRVDRSFDQETFSNFQDNSSYQSDWDQPWSDAFPSQDHPISDGPPFIDVDYKGEADISALYAMADLPLHENFKLLGGVRAERTELSIVNDPEADATWFPLGSVTAVKLNPGDADVDFDERSLLPMLGFELTALDDFTLRGSFAKTVARQTFKELTPILQQEFLGGPIFIGNPGLQMAELRNYDLRLDYAPSLDTLLSTSYFYKDIDDPIEYVQRVTTSFDYTTATNFPEGTLKGWEFEARQALGPLWDPLQGLSLGANATFIDSDVKLSQDDIDDFADLSPRTHRDATGAPDHLYNLFLTYDIERTGTQLGLFYTITGDTLVTGAGVANGNVVPDIYAQEYETLNFTLTQRLSESLRLKFQAKNLTNPRIKTEYREPGIPSVTRSSYTKGIDYSIALIAEVRF